MKVNAQFHCPGYSSPEFNDFEKFDSIADAKEEFWDRCHIDPRFPCVEAEEAQMNLFFGEPAEQDGWPDRILRIGPLGGVTCERVG